MDAEAFAREMLKTDSAIRYVAVVTNDYRVLTSKQREGVSPLTSDDMQRNFISIVPQIIIESVDKLSAFLEKGWRGNGPLRESPPIVLQICDHDRHHKLPARGCNAVLQSDHRSI